MADHRVLRTPLADRGISQGDQDGLRLESRQYLDAHRLEAVAGFTCVLTVRRLQLKTVATTHPDLSAERVIPKLWLKMLGALRQRKLTTVRDFFRHLAGLGGFLMRKRNGDPGWITLWRGLDKLILAVRGFVAMKQNVGKFKRQGQDHPRRERGQRHRTQDRKSHPSACEDGCGYSA